MINEITCNNNNAIEMSRGQLLQWVNNTLKLSYGKIEQMGSGAAYCKMLDLMYPGAVPMSKVNWKAKFDYEYVNNFKVLQQSFTKLNILKHIDVERLVKCKYQDNLEFLQWFKKIFDNSNVQIKDSEPITPPPTRKQEKSEKQKQNKIPPSTFSNSSMMNVSLESANKSTTNERNSSFQNGENSFIHRLTNDEKDNKEDQAQKQILKRFKYPIRYQKPDQNLLAILAESQNQQKQFYLRKLKEIQNLIENWDQAKTCGQLIGDVRNIILATPEVEWKEEQDGSD